MKNCYLLTYTITFKNGIRSSSMPKDVIAKDFAQAEQLLKKHLIETDENVASVTVTKSVMTAPNVLVEEVEDRYGAGVVDGYNDGYNSAVEDIEKPNPAYLTFHEFMDGQRKQSSSDKVLLMALATITTLPGFTDKTPDDVYDSLVEKAKIVEQPQQYDTPAMVEPMVETN